jgi:hypothetical protein
MNTTINTASAVSTNVYRLRRQLPSALAPADTALMDPCGHTDPGQQELTSRHKQQQQGAVDPRGDCP